MTLLEAAVVGLGALERELAGMLETSCLLDKDHNPRRETLDSDMVEMVGDLEAVVADVRAAIVKAKGAP